VSGERGGGAAAAGAGGAAEAGAGEAGAAFPWATLTAFGLGVLRWPPDAFWSATPAELLAAAGAMAGPAGLAPGRGDLAALMARFPDHGVERGPTAPGARRPGAGRTEQGAGDGGG